MKLSIRLGGVAIALALVLVACQQAAPASPTPGQPTPGQPTPGAQTPGQPTPGQPTGQPTPGQPTPGQPTPGESPAAQLEGNLTMWHTYGSGAPGVERGEAAALARALEIVRGENPGLNLTVTEVDFGQLFNTYQLQAADGIPDLFVAPNDSLGDLARAGIAQPLDDYFTDEELARFSQLAIDGSSLDGTLYQVPESLKAVAVYYDTNVVETFPATTEELLTAVQNGDFRLGLGGSIYHMFGFWGSFGGELMDAEGRCIADQTGVADAYAYIQDLVEAGAVWYPNYGDGAAAFNAGEVDAFIDGPWAGGGYQESHPDNLAVAPLPAGPAGPALPLTGVDGWTINPHSQNVDLAVAFAKRMTQPDILQIFADLAVHIPADTSVTTTDPLADDFAAAVESGLPRPQVPQLGAFWGNFGDALAAVLDAGEDPATAVANACRLMNEANEIE